MSEKTKNVLLGVLIVGLVSMTVAYAALSQTLNINGSAKVQAKGTSWNVHFTSEDGDHDPIETVGYAKTTTQGATLTLTNTDVTAPDVTLIAPGDKVSFYFDVVNEGEINAKLNSLPNNVSASGVLSGYTVAYADASASDAVLQALTSDIVVKLTYADGTAIGSTDTLKGTLHQPATDRRKDLVLTIEYVKSESEQELPSKEVTISGISSHLIYVQDTASSN